MAHYKGLYLLPPIIAPRNVVDSKMEKIDDRALGREGSKGHYPTGFTRVCSGKRPLVHFVRSSRLQVAFLLDFTKQTCFELLYTTAHQAAVASYQPHSRSKVFRVL